MEDDEQDPRVAEGPQPGADDDPAAGATASSSSAGAPAASAAVSAAAEQGERPARNAPHPDVVIEHAKDLLNSMYGESGYTLGEDTFVIKKAAFKKILKLSAADKKHAMDELQRRYDCCDKQRLNTRFLRPPKSLAQSNMRQLKTQLMSIKPSMIESPEELLHKKRQIDAIRTVVQTSLWAITYEDACAAIWLAIQDPVRVLAEAERATSEREAERQAAAARTATERAALQRQAAERAAAEQAVIEEQQRVDAEKRQAEAMRVVESNEDASNDRGPDQRPTETTSDTVGMEGDEETDKETDKEEDDNTETERVGPKPLSLAERKAMVIRAAAEHSAQLRQRDAQHYQESSFSSDKEAVISTSEQKVKADQVVSSQSTSQARPVGEKHSEDVAAVAHTLISALGQEAKRAPDPEGFISSSDVYRYPPKHLLGSTSLATAGQSLNFAPPMTKSHSGPCGLDILAIVSARDRVAATREEPGGKAAAALPLSRVSPRTTVLPPPSNARVGKNFVAITPRKPEPTDQKLPALPNRIVPRAGPVGALSSTNGRFRPQIRSRSELEHAIKARSANSSARIAQPPLVQARSTSRLESSSQRVMQRPSISVGSTSAVVATVKPSSVAAAIPPVPGTPTAGTVAAIFGRVDPDGDRLPDPPRTQVAVGSPPVTSGGTTVLTHSNGRNGNHNPKPMWGTPSGVQVPPTQLKAPPPTASSLVVPSNPRCVCSTGSKFCLLRLFCRLQPVCLFVRGSLIPTPTPALTLVPFVVRIVVCARDSIVSNARM